MVAHSKLSKSIQNMLLLSEGSLTDKGHFSWRSFRLRGKLAIPEPLDQGPTPHCIVYATYSLLLFQIKFIGLLDSAVLQYSPSLDYLLTLLKNGNTGDFFAKLAKKPFMDQLEYHRMNDEDAINRFSVDCEFLDPKWRSSLAKAKAAAKGGGAVFIIPSYYANENGDVLYAGNTRLRTHHSFDTTPGSGDTTGDDTTAVDTCFANHAVFVYGSEQSPNGTCFHYVNSYGKSFGVEGHHSVEWSEVIAVHILRLSFKSDGF